MTDYLYSGHYAPEIVKGNTRTVEQLLGHKVRVFQYGNLSWHAWDNDFLRPGGFLEKLCEVDFGEMASELDVREHILGRKGPQAKVSLPPRYQYLKDFFNMGLERRGQDFWYGFDICRNALSVERPLEFHITQYAFVGDQLINEERQNIIMLVRRKENTFEPIGDYFKVHRYSVQRSPFN